uniref:START domain-containing protein n=1 Tax=Macrostomum lignano TaxID=282301 RepID=A0A1I8HDH7_9PLAT
MTDATSSSSKNCSSSSGTSLSRDGGVGVIIDSSGSHTGSTCSSPEDSRTTAAVSSSCTRHGKTGRRALALRSNAAHWRKYWSNVHRKINRRHESGTWSESPAACGTASRSNSQLMAASDSSLTPDARLQDDLMSQNSNDTDVGSQSQQAPPEQERNTAKSVLANVIEKAILDFCSSRTVETMRRMFAGVTSELEALQGDAGRSGDKSALVPHPVTGELVKEGIVIGSMDVFAPRVHKEYRLEMKDSLVEGFLKDVGVFRAICYRTKCQLEVTRRLLNKKLCTGGRWVKYLIVRIVGPSLRAINSCDCLLQNAVPAFKSRIEYRKPAFCRMFFREDIPDNANLITSDRTIGSCPWKSGALKIGKLSFSGDGGHLCMRQVYPGYGYTETTPVNPMSKGVDALKRIEKMHGEFLNKRQQNVFDRRAMTIPVCR